MKFRMEYYLYGNTVTDKQVMEFESENVDDAIDFFFSFEKGNGMLLELLKEDGGKVQIIPAPD